MRQFHENQHEEHDRFSTYGNNDMMKKMMMKYQMKQMMEKFMNTDSYENTDFEMSYSPEHKFHHKDHSSKSRFNLGSMLRQVSFY